MALVQIGFHTTAAGLLDHLLKHAAEALVTDEGHRLRRRHNREGHMEYWLASPSDADAGARPATGHDTFWLLLAAGSWQPHSSAASFLGARCAVMREAMRFVVCGDRWSHTYSQWCCVFAGGHSSAKGSAPWQGLTMDLVIC